MLSQEFVVDYINTAIGKIPVVPRKLNFKDCLNAIKVRFNIGRMKYAVAPGLYAVGNPDTNSPVLVSANFKLSFDYLRRELPKIDAWILVLDTKGINVWCAAGKGTFGTEELIHRIRDVKLDELVKYRQLIVPQLGAAGVSAHRVKEATGFKVLYGPIRAADIPAFFEANNKASNEMRIVKFDMFDRLILVPVEVAQGFKYTLLLLAAIFILSGIYPSGYSIDRMLNLGIISVVCISFAFISGTLLTQLFLPYIPGRAFALKGFIMIIPIVLLLHQFYPAFRVIGLIEKTAWFLIMSTISSFFAMNFTGASTYTSLSGVKKEMRFAVPLQIIAFSIGLILWIVKRFI